MTAKDSETTRRRLTQVGDVGGADPAIRGEVSHRTEAVESATTALREAISELHQTDDEAWKRYAADLEDATLRLDAALGVASARLRSERAGSKEELQAALEEAAASWRARADEIRVQTHLGEMEARDAGLHALDDLERAGRRISAVTTSLRDDAGESLTALRGNARHALDELGQVLHDLRPSRNP